MTATESAKNTIIERRGDGEAVVEIQGKKIIIKFIGGNVWFMHLCELKPDYRGPDGINISGYIGNDLHYGCPYCEINGRLKWNPNPSASDKENLNLVLLQLIDAGSTIN